MQDTTQDEKLTLTRLFLGMELSAPWPENMPQGRIISSNARHMTFAFLGQKSLDEVGPALNLLPANPSMIGPATLMDHLQFFPEKPARVVALHVDFSAHVEWLNFFEEVRVWTRAHA